MLKLTLVDFSTLHVVFRALLDPDFTPKSETRTQNAKTDFSTIIHTNIT